MDIENACLISLLLTATKANFFDLPFPTSHSSMRTAYGKDSEPKAERYITL